MANARPDLDALQALLDKATPGPYYWFMRECADKDALIAELTEVVDKTDAINGYNLHGVAVGEPDPDADYLAVAHTGCGPRSPANAQLIVAAVNALPALVAYVRELEREREPRRDLGGSTHWDIADAGAVCHDECAVAQIKGAALAMRERCAEVCDSHAARALTAQKGDPADPINVNLRMIALLPEDCAAAIRALEV